MPFDLHKNLAIALVAVAPVPPDSGQQMSVPAGQGSRFSAPPFNVTIWKASEYPNPANAEVGRCTAVAGDVLTVLRAQEGTTARAVQVGDLIAQSVTDLYLQSIESGTNFPLIDTPGDITAGGNITSGGDMFANGGSVNADVVIAGQVLASGGSVLASGPISGQLGTFTSLDIGATAPLVSIESGTGNPQGVVVKPVGSLFLRNDGTVDATLYVKQGGTGSGFGWTAMASAGALPTLHAPTHSAGGADPVTVTALAGYPGGTTNFLRADGTFAPTAAGGGGDVVGPGSATDGNFAVFSGTTGKIIKESALVKIFSNGSISVGALTDGGAAGRVTIHGNAASGSWVDLMVGVGLRALRAHHSSGVSIGDATDPGTGSLRVAGTLFMPQAVAGVQMVGSNQQQQFGTTAFGGMLTIFGNTRGATPGNVLLQTGTAAAAVMDFSTGAVSTVRQRIHPSGGVSFGDTTDPGAGNVSVAGKLVLTHTGGYPGGTVNFLRADGTFAAPPGGGGVALHASTHVVGGSDVIPNVAWTNVANTFTQNQTITGTLSVSSQVTCNLVQSVNGIVNTTVDGTDNGFISVAGGGGAAANRGAFIRLYGNEHVANSGQLLLGGGDTPTSKITLSASTMTKLVFFPSGGLGFGLDPADPGMFNLGVFGDLRASSVTTPLLSPGTLDGSDLQALTVCGGGSNSPDRGAYITLAGNEHAQWPGSMFLNTGNAVGAYISFLFAGATKGRMHPTGGFSWGSTVDPGAGNLAVNGDLILEKGAPAYRQIRLNTADGADTGVFYINGGGAVADANRGAWLSLGGNESVNTGNLQLVAGNTASGNISFWTGPTTERGRIHPSGGFSWGSVNDAGANNLRIGGDVAVEAAGATFRHSVANSYLALCGGSGAGPASGATIYMHGNQDIAGGVPGGVQIHAGTVPTGLIRFATQGLERGVISASGGFSWGTTTDPGAGNICLGETSRITKSVTGSPGVAGQDFFDLGYTPGISASVFRIGTSAPASTICYFLTSAGLAGTISVSGTASAYNTTSDARLKTDRGVLISTDVLPRLTVHAFDWQDGTPGRGVFAQEAAAVAPFAVSEGTDERDEQGRLTHPWGVDYSKFIPDLIAGWQAHEAELARLRAELAALKSALGEA